MSNRHTHTSNGRFAKKPKLAKIANAPAVTAEVIPANIHDSQTSASSSKARQRNVNGQFVGAASRSKGVSDADCTPSKKKQNGCLQKQERKRTPNGAHYLATRAPVQFRRVSRFILQTLESNEAVHDGDSTSTRISHRRKKYDLGQPVWFTDLQKNIWNNATVVTTENSYGMVQIKLNDKSALPSQQLMLVKYQQLDSPWKIFLKDKLRITLQGEVFDVVVVACDYQGRKVRVEFEPDESDSIPFLTMDYRQACTSLILKDNASNKKTTTPAEVFMTIRSRKLLQPKPNTGEKCFWHADAVVAREYRIGSKNYPTISQVEWDAGHGQSFFVDDAVCCLGLSQASQMEGRVSFCTFSITHCTRCIIYVVDLDFFFQCLQIFFFFSVLRKPAHDSTPAERKNNVFGGKIPPTWNERGEIKICTNNEEDVGKREWKDFNYSLDYSDHVIPSVEYFNKGCAPSNMDELFWCDVPPVMRPAEPHTSEDEQELTIAKIIVLLETFKIYGIQKKKDAAGGEDPATLDSMVCAAKKVILSTRN